MTDFEDGASRLSATLSDIETSLETTEDVGRAFRAEMDEVRGAMAAATRDANGLSRTVGTGLRKSFDALIFDGAKLSDVLNGLGRSVARKSFNSAITPVTDALGRAVTSGVQGLIGAAVPFANGGAFGGGRTRAFASGGVVSGPTAFPMRGGGTGLMGEAGPEAILPLSRGPDGKLGVRSGGGGRPVNVVINISTPDVAGFRKSQPQIASEMRRALARGNRNM